MYHRILAITIATGLLCLLGLGTPASANSCPEEETSCGGVCLDLDTTDLHCGACGVRCAKHEACSQGTCRTVCPPTQLVCEDICVTPSVDEQHCGGCGITCSENEFCRAGTCQSIDQLGICPIRQVQCRGKCADLQVDWQNCGACGKTCGVDKKCINGQCKDQCQTIEIANPIPGPNDLQRR